MDFIETDKFFNKCDGCGVVVKMETLGQREGEIGVRMGLGTCKCEKIYHTEFLITDKESSGDELTRRLMS